MESIVLKVIVCFIAGIGAGVGTGFAGMSAAAAISPILITFLGMEPYEAVGIALASDVLASAVSAHTYWKNKNLDVKNGLVMMITVLIFTTIGSFVSSLVPSNTMGGFSVFMTMVLGVKFIVKPVMTTKEMMAELDSKQRAIRSIICGGLIGFICGFIGAGGGMMMLLVLTTVLGYELKTAVGTSVFVMAFTAFTQNIVILFLMSFQIFRIRLRIRQRGFQLNIFIFVPEHYNRLGKINISSFCHTCNKRIISRFY